MSYSQKWEIGGSVGTTGYMGDLNPDNPLQYNNIGISAAVKKNLNPTWGIRANVSFVPVSWAGNYNQVVSNDVNFSNKRSEERRVGKECRKQRYQKDEKNNRELET